MHHIQASSQNASFFKCKLRPEPELGAALAGLGSELGLEIYKAQALESQAKATASRPSRAVASLILKHPTKKLVDLPMYLLHKLLEGIYWGGEQEHGEGLIEVQVIEQEGSKGGRMCKAQVIPDCYCKFQLQLKISQRTYS